MGQICKSTRSDINLTIENVLPIAQQKQAKRPIFELQYIRGRRETRDESYEFDLETIKSISVKKEIRLYHSSKTTFQMGVQHQKYLLKEQLKLSGGDLSQIFTKKPKQTKLHSENIIKKESHIKKSKTDNNNYIRKASVSSDANKSVANSQSPLQFSPSANVSIDSLKAESKSLKTLKPQSTQGILKQKKSKSKSLYQRRSVRFQF